MGFVYFILSVIHLKKCSRLDNTYLIRKWFCHLQQIGATFLLEGTFHYAEIQAQT